MQKFNLLNDNLSVKDEREYIRDFIKRKSYRVISNNSETEHYASVSVIFNCCVSGDDAEKTEEMLIDKILEDNDFKGYILKVYK